VRAQLISDATFERIVGDDISRIQAFFNTPRRIYTEVLSTDTEHKRAKGVLRYYVKRRLKHEDYLRVLNDWRPTHCEFQTFRSKRHVVTTRKMRKISLNCFDTKRYLLADGIRSLAYGHWRIGEGGFGRCPGPRVRPPSLSLRGEGINYQKRYQKKNKTKSRQTAVVLFWKCDGWRHGLVV